MRGRPGRDAGRKVVQQHAQHGRVQPRRRDLDEHRFRRFFRFDDQKWAADPFLFDHPSDPRRRLRRISVAERPIVTPVVEQRYAGQFADRGEAVAIIVPLQAAGDGRRGGGALSVSRQVMVIPRQASNDALATPCSDYRVKHRERNFQHRELARPTGTKVETIRHYERIGLLPAPARTVGNYRAYTRQHLERLNFIREAVISASLWIRSASCFASPTIPISRAPRLAELPGSIWSKWNASSPTSARSPPSFGG
jgi:hypothetical protein